MEDSKLLKLNLKSVRTPTPLSLPTKSISIHEISTRLSDELSSSSSWNQKCSDILTQNLPALFMYDRFECMLTRAYGGAYKIALNPIMMICYHPNCRKKKQPYVKLRHCFNMNEYLMHLKNHSDVIGTAMQRRFSAVAENPFISTTELDAISQSPHSLNPYLDSLTSKRTLPQQHIAAMNAFAIDRRLKTNYLCHWKDKLINEHYVDSNSLLFQEDDAYIYCLLQYPHTVHDWSLWNTISLFCMKIYAAVGGTALCLYRGVTRTRQCRGAETDDFQSFIKNMNHPGPSVSSIQRLYPALNYQSNVFHKAELLFHLQLLSKNDDSIKIKFPGITRYLCTLGIDEQEINQGTFHHKGKLYGLKKVLTEKILEEMGLKNLPKHIAEENSFITDVREYRLTDFKGLYCSNLYSSFESEPMKYEQCLETLSDVTSLARKCLNCLNEDAACEYDKVNDKCSLCALKGQHCISMITFHVLWDMASFQKKANRCSMTKVTLTSNEDDFLMAKLTTIGFGGLHLCKGCVNCFRNNVLTFKGENYGLGVLRAYKSESTTLSHVKGAVFVAKDRQSDFLAFMTVGSVVQEFLEKQKIYSVERLPEPVLTYAENAKSQKPIVLPAGILANDNGDVFVLDTRGCVIHIIDRSGVAKCYLLGSYCKPDFGKYHNSSNKDLKMKDLKLSNNLTGMCFDEDGKFFISDKGRGEIVIVRKACPARAVVSSAFNILEFEDCTSICSAGKYIATLVNQNGKNTIKILSVEVPSGKERYKLHADHKVVTIINTDIQKKSIFTVSGSAKCFGEWSSEGKVNFYCCSNKKWVKTTTSLSSSSIPCSGSKLSLLSTLNEVSHYNIHNTGAAIEVSAVETKLKLCDRAHYYYQWGQVTYVIKQKAENVYCLVELGPLQFGAQFSKAVMDFYEAISYFPPHTKHYQNLNLQQCIDLGSNLQNLLESMHDEAERRYSTRHSFTGTDGVPFTETIQCVSETVDSWRALKNRLDYFDPKIAKNIYSHAVTNESLVEHSFGFISRKSQGNSLSMQEYIQCKRNHMVDFLLKMCDLPFSQYASGKVRDKGYQDMQECGKVKLTMGEVKQVLQVCSKDYDVDDDVDSEGEDPNSLVRKAYLLSKTVPRQTTRSKWREKSGHGPNMLEKTACNGKLLTGDLVFHHNIENRLLSYVIQQDILLTNVDSCAIVTEVDKIDVLRIDVSKLIVHCGRILCIPKELYTLEDGQFVLHDNIDGHVLDSLVSANNSVDEELLQLPDIEPVSGGVPDGDYVFSEQSQSSSSFNNEQPVPSKELFKRNSQPNNDDEDEVVTFKKKKRKPVLSSEDEEDEESFHKHNANIGEWVVVEYNHLPYIGHIINIDAFHGYQVTTLENCGKSNCFKWSTDSIWYKEILVGDLDELKPANNRGALKLSDADYDTYKKLF